MPNWLSLGFMALTKIPFEKIILKKPDPVERVERLRTILSKESRESSPTAIPEPRPALGEARRGSGEALAKQKGVSTEETIAYQKRELGKELLLLEKHLQQSCKIGGKACDCCLEPGTLIYSNPGIATIERPSVKVITHQGNIERVSHEFERDYTGPMQEIMATYTNFPLRMTPEHPVLVAKNIRRRQRDIWRPHGIAESSLSWIAASDITDRDFMVFPKLKKIENKSEINLKMAELLGWYVSEGSVTGNRVTFSLGKHEKENIARVKSLINDVFGGFPQQYFKPTVLHICYTNKDRVGVFREFGTQARNKQLPDWMLYLPKEKQVAFIKAAFSGDGNESKYALRYTTTSQVLAYQLRLILFRLGILHSFGERPIGESSIDGRTIKPNGPRYDISISGDAGRLLGMDGGCRKVGNHGWVGENYVFLPVRSNHQIPFSGKVYNIAVEDDESYVTAHGVIHNCEKHPLAIEALAQEALGITGDPLYSEIAGWSRKISPMTTAEASESGTHDDEYPGIAVEARSLRKRIMGTADVKALMDPALSSKVKKEVADILDRAIQKKGGNDDTGEQQAV